MKHDIPALVADNRKWVQLHRENKYQREAAKRMSGVLDALEREHERAEHNALQEAGLRDDIPSIEAERDAAVQRAERAEAAIREVLEVLWSPYPGKPVREGSRVGPYDFQRATEESRRILSAENNEREEKP